jgi:hypothetical protein
MKKFPLVILTLVAFEPSNAAIAAGLRALMPVKAPRPVPAYDWTGFYLGGHFGYAAGSSDWSATQIGTAAPTVTGALDLFNTYDAFKEPEASSEVSRPDIITCSPRAWCSALRRTRRSRI